MRLLALILALSDVLIPFANAQGRPDVSAQKLAMEKIKFLAGTWTGEAIISLGEGKQMTISQTEDVQYRLDGLLMLIEGTGRDKSGRIIFNAVAAVSFDEKSGTYRIRAWNSGNFVETEMKVAGMGFEWGFQQGPMTVVDRMVIDEQGRWSETSEATLTDGRKLHTVKMMLTRKP
ncbi:MAG TPA: hypothetical protein VEQ63_10970 [Bryobacteraceae bacterium]|nr:hypothetical protein [Bryobacteraceae bacterium]